MIYPQNFENKIGYDQIRHLLKARCLSTLGEQRVEEMHFSDRFEEVEEWLQQTCEMMEILQGEEEFPAQYYYDVRPSLARIRVEGLYLDETELFWEPVSDDISEMVYVPEESFRQNRQVPFHHWLKEQ